MQEALKELGTLIVDAEQLFQRFGNEGKECFGDSAVALRDSIAKMRDMFAHVERQFQHEFRRKVRDANRFVEHHPWQSMAGAAMIGFLLGAAMNRRD